MTLIFPPLRTYPVTDIEKSERDYVDNFIKIMYVESWSGTFSAQAQNSLASISLMSAVKVEKIEEFCCKI